MLKVYCYSRCTTCKKALKWLEDHGIEHTMIDIKSEHPDEKTLRKYYAVSGLPLKRFFNTSGIPYRELELSKKFLCTYRIQRRGMEGKAALTQETYPDEGAEL